MNRRYFFFAGTFFLTLLLYIDRVAISSSKEMIGGDLTLSDTQIGWVLAAFSLGYALFQVPVGAIGDRLGPRKVLTSIIAIWSAFTLLTGAAWNYLSMLLFRFAFGAGEAGAFPNISRAAFNWVPLPERGIFQGINFSGSRLGAAFALPMVAYCLEIWGWRPVFYALGVIGVGIAVFFWLAFRDRPEEHAGLRQEEKDYIAQHREKRKSGAILPLNWPQVFGSRNVWLAMAQYIGSNFIFFFTLTWLFPYLKQRYELDLLTTGLYAMLPLMAGAAGNWVSGWWVDFLYRKGQKVASRRWPAMVGFVLVVIGVGASLGQSEVGPAVAFLCLAIFGADMTLSPSWSFCIDIGREHAGRVSGLMNMAGNLGSFVTALAFPYLQAWTGSTDLFFYLAMGLALLSILAWSGMNPTQPLVSDSSETLTQSNP